MFDAQQFFARRRVAVSRQILGERTTDHELHQLTLGELGGRLRRDVLAIAQHADRVAQPVDLRHAMRDVDARHAARFEPVDQRIETICLVLTQAAGGLVEHDDARPAADGHRDLDDLLLCDREFTQAQRDVEIRTDLC